MPCPLDPNHTVYEVKLKAHLKVCSKGRQMHGAYDQPYYRAGINSGTPQGEGAVRVSEPANE